MFCPKCGAELPDDSQFCRKCGKALTTTTPPETMATTGAAPEVAPTLPTAQPKSRRAIWFWFLIPLLVLLAWLLGQMNKPDKGGSPLQQLTAQQYTETLPQNNFPVTPLGVNSVKFQVPPSAFNVRLEGNFSAAGGWGNDIETYVFDEDGFINWQNRHPATTYYKSGRVTRGSINTALPGPGVYYVVFNNRFSLISAKTVEAHVTLYYSK